MLQLFIITIIKPFASYLIKKLPSSFKTGVHEFLGQKTSRIYYQKQTTMSGILSFSKNLHFPSGFFIF